MSERPTKRLKQSSLLDCFKLQSSTSSSKLEKCNSDNGVGSDSKLETDSNLKLKTDSDLKLKTDGDSKLKTDGDSKLKTEDLCMSDQVNRSSDKRKRNVNKHSNSEDKETTIPAGIQVNCDSDTSISKIKTNEPQSEQVTKEPVPSTSAQADAMADAANQDSLDSTAQYPLSPDLFSDSSQSQETSGASIEDIEPVQSSAVETQMRCLGTAISELRTAASRCVPIAPLKASQQHTVLYQVPHTYTETKPPSPYPAFYNCKDDLWDNYHVRMPCSHHNEYPVNGKAVRRWNLIEKTLLQDMKDTLQLQEAILAYNTRYSKRWDFSALHRLFFEVYPAEKTKQFFDKTLKDMIRLALQLPHLCTQPIPLLLAHQNHSITMSQQQAASLLANAFFCTFPRRNAHHRNSEYASYPNINFNGLFAAGHIPRKVEKLKCIINYFTRVTTRMPTGSLMFTRQSLQPNQLPDWDNCSKPLTRLHVSTSGTIEDNGSGMLQVDFANKYLGGGVLGHGCVQEEIRFLICPEMIVPMLFTEVMDKHECVIMTGCEMFSDYTGYADTFKWSKNHVDATLRDEWGRLQTEVVAIDALVVRDHCTQFKMWAVRRELEKAYTGFSCLNQQHGEEQLVAVCTGNWGCGAFGGNKRLKALLQVMAASAAGRDVCYFTFNDDELCRDLHDIHKLLSNLRISDIMLYIQQYYRNVCLKSRGIPLLNLYDYIHSCVLGKGDTDSDESIHSDDISVNPNSKLS